MENDKDKDGVVVEPVVETDPIAEKDEEIAKLKDDLENYKIVALKRLGKLPGDAAFLAGEGKSELSVEEQVKMILLQKEIDASEKAKDELSKKLVRENSELRLALKNRPDQALGSDSGNGGLVVKDNILTEAQITSLTAKAKSIGADPEKFIANYKKTLANQK